MLSTRPFERVYPEQQLNEVIVHRLVHALHLGSVELMAQAAGSDRVIEPARARLMPFLREAQEVAAKAGALATVISGAGPSICAFCNNSRQAESVRGALSVFYFERGIQAISQATRPAKSGAMLLEH